MRRPLLAVIVLLAGCSRINSNEVKTGFVKGEFTITADGSSRPHVEGRLLAGIDYLHLTSGDRLTANDGSTRVTFVEERQPLNDTKFTADLSTDEPGTDVTIAFERDGFPSAPASVVTMPRRFEITSTWSSDESVSVEWDVPADDEEPMQWTASGCVGETSSGTVRWGTSLSVELSPTDGEGNSLCFVDVLLSRTREGTLDPAYIEGFVRAKQERKASFVLIR